MYTGSPCLASPAAVNIPTGSPCLAFPSSSRLCWLDAALPPAPTPSREHAWCDALSISNPLRFRAASAGAPSHALERLLCQVSGHDRSWGAAICPQTPSIYCGFMVFSWPRPKGEVNSTARSVCVFVCVFVCLCVCAQRLTSQLSNNDQSLNSLVSLLQCRYSIGHNFWTAGGIFKL